MGYLTWFGYKNNISRKSVIIEILFAFPSEKRNTVEIVRRTRDSFCFILSIFYSFMGDDERFTEST